MKKNIMRPGPLDTDTHKQCTVCRSVKPRSEFYKDGRSADGIAHSCSDCVKEQVKQSKERRKRGEITPVNRPGNPNDTDTHKQCRKCGEVKSRDEFYTSKVVKDGNMSYCKDCIRQNKKANREKYLERYRARRRKIKVQLIERLGGKCSQCGYSRSPFALDFHHVDAEDKEHQITVLIKYASRYKSSFRMKQLHDEVDKCVLLCANCHREHHFDAEI